jgi:hypothetical protein
VELTSDGINLDDLTFGCSSVSNDLDEDPLLSSAVEFAVEELFPRAEIQFAGRDRDHDFAAHDLTLQMRVGVIFAGAIVVVGRGGRVRRQFLQPNLVIVVQTGFIIVDEDRRGDVHGVDQAKTFFHAAPANQLLDCRRDVDEPAATRNFEPEMFGKRFQVRKG